MGWYSSIPSLTNLECWLDNRLNVLFHGRHGVGKTSIVAEAFHKRGWELGRDYLYFSAATIDPWVDLIGVPARVTNEEGEEVLKLIRPENIHNRTIKAFFVDELNRSHKKVRNAMMELIQFKSINGLKFENLEVVWAAVNPDDDDELKFDVEKLDPAQEDRFQIHVHIPYKPSKAYFAEKFANPDMAEAVCKWWDNLPEKVKLQVTPRRLEYAIDVYQKTGDLRYVIPTEANGAVLKNAIECGNPEKTLQGLILAGDDAATRKWLAVENNLNATQNMICNNKQVCAKVLHLLSEERFVSLATKHKTIIDQIKAEPKKYESVIRNLAENSTQKMLKETCAKLVKYLDASEKTLDKVTVPTRSPSELKISKRQKAKMFGNYEINDAQTISMIANPAEQISKPLSNIVSECAFVSNTVQRSEILQKLGEIIYPEMSKEETDVCIKVVESCVGYINDLSIIKRYLPVINTCVKSWRRTSNTASMERLFSVAPFLTSMLVTIHDNKHAMVSQDEDTVVVKKNNNEYEDIEDIVEMSPSQNIENYL